MHVGHSGSVRPYYEDADAVIYHGDCREILPLLAPVDAIITDPPYGDTSLEWDRWPGDAWLEQSADLTRVMWCFGSMRMWLDRGDDFRGASWTYGQEIVWEKHNGSGFHADRFKRVHELVVHWYRGEWGGIHKDPPVTLDATARQVRRKQRPPHTGHIEASSYVSEDGGPRLMRSVLQVRSCHGYAENETQKPTGILRPLIAYSCRPGGTVLDPFMGAGSTLVAARELGRKSIGIDLREAQCAVAARRLGQGVLNVA